MSVGFLECYVLSFLSVAVGFAFLGACTTVFYRKKTWGQLRRNELKVKQGTASPEDRFDIFFRSLATSFLTWQLHLIALGFALFYWFGTQILRG